jgi:hypothetical protein
VPIYSFKLEEGAYEACFHGNIDRAIEDLTSRNEAAGRSVDVTRVGANLATFVLRYPNINREINGTIYSREGANGDLGVNLQHVERRILKYKKQRMAETRIVEKMNLPAALVRQIVRGLSMYNELPPYKRSYNKDD